MLKEKKASAGKGFISIAMIMYPILERDKVLNIKPAGAAPDSLCGCLCGSYQP